jgi:crotonobetaine/carnitine-CoA ligase
MMEKSTEFDDQLLRYQTTDQILENRAKHLGDETYIQYEPGGENVTFAELNEGANRIGNSVRNRGIRSGDPVSVMLRNPLQTVFALAGINKAGAVFSPINFEYKGEVLEYQLNDTDPDLLIIEDQYVERLNAIRPQLDSLPELVVYESSSDGETPDNEFTSSMFDDVSSGDSSSPDVTVSWDDPAAIIYTSGTTGRPKGVVHSHRLIYDNFLQPKLALIDRSDVIHCALPMYHVSGAYMDFLGSLTTGAGLALWDRFTPNEFWDRVDKYDATMTTLMSVMIPWLSESEPAENDRNNTLYKVRMAPVPDNYQDLADRYGFDIVATSYSSTEIGCAVLGLFHAAQGDTATPDRYKVGRSTEAVIEVSEQIGMPVVEDPPGDQHMYAGKAMDRVVELSVRYEDDEAAERGEIAELCLRPTSAEALFQRYYGKPERTVEAFRNLWFHTGDAGYVDEDGHCYFAGRMRGIIRRRGENVSAMQVEEIVGSLDVIAEVAAFPEPAEKGGEDVVAVAVTRAEGLSEADFAKADLLSALEPKMPDFMRPDDVYFVGDMPTTGTGKIAKSELVDQLDT